MMKMMSSGAERCDVLRMNRGTNATCIVLVFYWHGNGIIAPAVEEPLMNGTL